MAELSVLVVGGGVAGAVLGYWLAKGDAKVTIIERSAKSLEYGQGIDVEGTPREIVRRMGVLDEMKARSTGEGGFACLDDDANVLAWVPGLLTSDIEIMRGDLTDILLTAADKSDKVEIKFGVTITAIAQTASKVMVTFDDESKQEYDVVVGADGIRSRTRSLILDAEESKSAIKALDVYTAFFSIPAEEGDKKFATLQSAPGRRSTCIRPINKDRSSAFLSAIGKDDRLESISKQTDRELQKKALHERFAGVKGQVPRILSGLATSENFYFERISQVKLPKWYSGRCGLVGDAAYAPSPLTGEGTNLAIVGAYVMAGELLAAPQDPAKAFESYQSKFRKYVESGQDIPLGGWAPFLLHPESTWGVSALRLFFRVIAGSGVWKVFSWKEVEPKEVKLPSWIPDYAQFRPFR